MTCDICNKKTAYLESLDYCSVCIDCLGEIDTENDKDLFEELDTENKKENK